MELFSSELTTPIKQSASHSSYDTAGSSSFLHAPSLSVITATPQSSQSRSRRQSGANSDLGSDNLQVPPVPALPEQSEKGKGKRKADNSEDVAPPEKRSSKTKKTTFAEGGKRKSFPFPLASFCEHVYQSNILFQVHTAIRTLPSHRLRSNHFSLQKVENVYVCHHRHLSMSSFVSQTLKAI